MKKTKIFQKCFIGILFVAAGGIYVGTSISKTMDSDEKSVVTSTKIQEEEITIPLTQTISSESVLTPSVIEEEKQIVVHICGCVTCPDVYELKENSRVIDAVNAAKGFTGNAALDSVNQAQLLTDGERIYIPSKEEIKEGLILNESVPVDSDSNENQKINLNLATKEELMTLPGIGDAKAERILAYRKEHGGFQTIEDIKQITGVKEAVFSKVKDLITVK